MSMKDILRAQLGDDFDNDKFAALLEAAETESQTVLDSVTKGLKTNQTKNLDQIARLKENQLPDGFDSEAFNTYLEDKGKLDDEKRALEDKRLESEGQWEALKNNLVSSHEQAILKLGGDKDQEISALRNSLDKELLENSAIKAIEKEKGNSFFLLPHMKDSMKTELVDGAYVTQVIDAEGNQRFDDKGEAFSVSALVAEMKTKDQFAPAFPNQDSGSGSGPNAGGGGGSTVNPWKAETKNITAQAKMNKENPILADQMKKAAGVG